MKRLFAVLLTLILCCSPVLGSTVFAGHIWHVAHEGEVEEWNGPFEHETLAFYFPDPDVPELAVRGLRHIKHIDDIGNGIKGIINDQRCYRGGSHQSCLGLFLKFFLTFNLRFSTHAYTPLYNITFLLRKQAKFIFLLHLLGKSIMI